MSGTSGNCDLSRKQVLWDLYATTVFLTAHPLPWRGQFGIVTACNPGSEPLSAGANRIRDRALQAELRDAGYPHIEIWGCSPDLDYRERSWAVWSDASHIIDIGRRHQQSAVFFVDEDVLWLMSCHSDDPLPARDLGRFSARLVAGD